MCIMHSDVNRRMPHSLETILMSRKEGFPLHTPLNSTNQLEMFKADSSQVTMGTDLSLTDTEVANQSLGSLVVPRNLSFNDDTLVSVIAYSVLFFVAACGNLTVFITLFRNRHRKSRVNLFIMHLSIADMIVTFIMIPMEIGWHTTVAWKAGDMACRLLMFCRAFGFYLSSFILVAISLDRYFAITHPLSITDADRRGKLMLLLAWLFGFVASIPQSVIFHVEKHPKFAWYEQCVTFNFYPTPAHELAYNLFNMAALYWAPLLIIIIVYSMILWEISKKSRQSKEQTTEAKGNIRCRQTFRHSGIGRIEKARIRTLKMTIVIVLVFVACWTPYFVINAWFWVDKKSAEKINTKVTRGLLIFAVSNSCVNPIVYGMFTNTFAREFKKVCWSRIKRRSESNSKVSTSCRVGHQLMQQLRKLPSDNIPETSGKPYPQARNVGASISPCGTQLPGSFHSNSSNRSNKRPVKRRMTPPHISQGMGQKESFDKYLLI